MATEEYKAKFNNLMQELGTVGPETKCSPPGLSIRPQFSLGILEKMEKEVEIPAVCMCIKDQE